MIRLLLSSLKSARFGTVPQRMFVSKQNFDWRTAEPVKFSQSKAAKWKSRQSNYGQDLDTPESRQWSIFFSLAAFMIYFGIMREENDIDEILGRDSVTVFRDLEKHGITVPQDNYDYNAFVRNLSSPKQSESNNPYK